MILVTGGTGFIGRNLVARLMADGLQIRCLLPENRASSLPWSQMPEIITGSLRDEETAFKAVSGAHTIIHLESAQWWGRTSDLERVELVGTRNLVTAARRRVTREPTLSVGHSEVRRYRKTLLGWLEGLTTANIKRWKTLFARH